MTSNRSRKKDEGKKERRQTKWFKMKNKTATTNKTQQKHKILFNYSFSFDPLLT